MGRILVTGGAGFIGSHLCERLLADREDVLCLDNLLTGNEENVFALRRSPCFTLIVADATAPFDVEGPFDAVVHLASPASPRDFERFPIQTLLAGAWGTFHALQLAHARGAVLLLASSSEVYGDPLVHPQPEEYWGNVNPIGPRSVYDEGKRFAEALATAYARAHCVEVRIARIFNTYGPRMRLNDGRVLPNFITQGLRGEPLTVYGDGSQTRSFCLVDDLVEGLVRLLRSSVRTPVNLGNPDEVRIIDLAREVITLTGGRSVIEFRPPLPDDPRVRRPDITRATTLLGWTPRVSRADGLRRTIANFSARLQLPIRPG